MKSWVEALALLTIGLVAGVVIGRWRDSPSSPPPGDVSAQWIPGHWRVLAPGEPFREIVPDGNGGERPIYDFPDE